MRTTPEPATADLPADPAPAISDDQRRFDARPAKLRPRARRGRTAQDERARKPFAPDGRNRAYVDWLVEQSMLDLVLATVHRAPFVAARAEVRP